jgi:hypothetical protein
MRHRQECLCHKTTSFEELQAYGLGYLKSAAQAECYRVFDKMVERASREMNEGYGPSDLTRIRAIR